MLTDLIFDFFGTLVSYTHGMAPDASYGTTHRLLLDCGFSVEYDVFIRELNQVFEHLDQQAKATCVEYHSYEAGRMFFSTCFGREAPTDVLEHFIDTFSMEWNRGTIFYPEIKPFISRLAARYRLSIITNAHYPPLVARNLAAMGITDYFAHVLTSVEFGVRKPDPHIFRDALRRLSISPHAATYVGDSFDDDYRGAAAAGIRCILVDPGRRWHGLVDDRVDRLFDIERLLP